MNAFFTDFLIEATSKIASKLTGELMPQFAHLDIVAPEGCVNGYDDQETTTGAIASAKDQTPVVENPLAEWVAAIITSRAAAARQCANCETCEPGKYHVTPWDDILCDDCYRDGGYAAAIDSGTAWFSDDFATFEIAPAA